MTSITEIRERQRRVDEAKQSFGQTQQSFAQSQQALAALPEALKRLSRQVGGIRQTIDANQEVSAGTLDVLAQTCVWVERVYDRLDDLTAEQRVTNQLLAELVAVQKSVIQDDVTREQDIVLRQAHKRALGGG